MFKLLTSILISLATILGLGLALPANASEPEVIEDAPVVSEADYRALITDLMATGAKEKNGSVIDKVPGYGKVAFADPDNPPVDKSTPEITPQLGGGWSGWSGPYVSFNRTDQGALLAGGSAALAAAICVIPAVGQAACIAAAAIVAAAFYYLTEFGRCPTRKPNLRVYVWSRKGGCYS